MYKKAWWTSNDCYLALLVAFAVVAVQIWLVPSRLLVFCKRSRNGRERLLRHLSERINGRPTALLKSLLLIRDFKIQRRGRRRKRKKNNRSYNQNNNFARASRSFVHFFTRFFTTTTWKWLISRFMEYVNKQRRNAISLSELGYGPWEFISRRARLHLIR